MTLPVSKYELKIGSDAFTPVSDIEDESLWEVLRWLYSARVLKLGDRSVNFQEELRYKVQHDEVSVNEGKWNATIRVFDIRDREDKTLEFRLVNK